MNDEQKARVIANCEVIAKALREGKALEWRTYDSFEDWAPSVNLNPNVASNITYRIKPEPRTIWVNEYGDDPDAVHDSKDSAMRSAGAYATRIAVEYREVVK